MLFRTTRAHVTDVCACIPAPQTLPVGRSYPLLGFVLVLANNAHIATSATPAPAVPATAHAGGETNFAAAKGV